METSNRYSELVDLKRRLQARLDTLQQQLADAKVKYQAVVTTLEMLGYRAHEDIAQGNLLVVQSEYKGLTQVQALEKIARENHGRFTMRDAKRILLAAGLIKNPKNASNILFSAIQRSDKFSRVAPGEYEIKKGEEKPLLAEAARK
jgi:hypothetical protein